MFSTSRDILNLAIALAVLLVAGYLSFLFFHLANLTKESKKSVERVNSQLDRVDGLMNEIIPTVQGINGTVRKIHESLVSPINSLLGIFKRITKLNDEE